MTRGQLSGNGSGLSSDQVQKRFPNGSRGSRPGIAVLDVLDDALFMPNQTLKRFVKKYIDFHQKFAKIEDFKV